MNSFRDDDQMDECNAALVLMSLSGSPHSPRQWMLGSSPGSSSASWTSGSDELSDEGTPATGHISNQHSPNRLRTASLSTSDEGIVMDYNDETPRKRRVSTVFFHISFTILQFPNCCCFFFSFVFYSRLTIRIDLSITTIYILVCALCGVRYVATEPYLHLY